MKVCNVAGIPDNKSLGHWMSTNASPARAIVKTYWDTASVVHLLGTLAKTQHSHSLLIITGNAMNWMFIYILCGRYYSGFCMAVQDLNMQVSAQTIKEEAMRHTYWMQRAMMSGL